MNVVVAVFIVDELVVIVVDGLLVVKDSISLKFIRSIERADDLVLTEVLEVVTNAVDWK